MTWRQIESRRETRLWIKEIVIPLVCTAGVLYANPKTRERISSGAKKVKESVLKLFRK